MDFFLVSTTHLRLWPSVEMHLCHSRECGKCRQILEQLDPSFRIQDERRNAQRHPRHYKEGPLSTCLRASKIVSFHFPRIARPLLAVLDSTMSALGPKADKHPCRVQRPLSRAKRT